MPSFTVFQGAKDGTIKQAMTTRPDELTGDLVLVKITASGVCGTGRSPEFHRAMVWVANKFDLE